MKILELFSGYGTATFALKRLGIPHEIVGYSDIDKYANQCFQQNHGGKELGDVKLINPNDLEDFDLLTAGFPCQSFSVAGKGLGELDPRGTLFYEIIRIAEVKKPGYMLLENVKGLTNKTHKATFDKILSELDRIGYKVYWKVLNSKDYGIPQSRARVWFVCFRKDIDKGFEFPEPVELKIFIKDILEENVDPKYYLSEKLQERFAKYLEEKNRKLSEKEPAILDLYNKKVKIDGTSITLSDPCHNNLRLIEGTCVAMRSYPRSGTKEEGGERFQNLEERDDGCSNSLTSVQKDNLVITGFQKHQSIKKDGISNALPSAMGMGGGHHPIVYDRKGFDSRTKGFRENELSPTLSQKMGTGGNNVPMVMNTITTAFGRRGHSKEELDMIEKVANCIKVGGLPTKPEHYYEKKHSNITGQVGMLRRLTPKECFRLMGFLNDEINLDGLSDTQRYKLAGNGQDVNMVSLIFKEMFK